MSQVVNNLQAARDLLAGEGAWIEGTFAGIDGEGNAAVGSSDPKANCWCMLGALGNVCDDGGYREEKAIEDAITSSGHQYKSSLRIVPAFNDAEGRTVGEILAMFDKAIAVETLKAARAVIEDERNWTKGGCVSVSAGADDGRCFCAIGAVGYTAAGDAWIDVREDYIDWKEEVFDPYDSEKTPALRFLKAAANTVSNGRYPFAYLYNDQPERTHAEVLALFDKAIELASAS